MEMQNFSNTDNTFTKLKTDTELTGILNYQFFRLSSHDIIEKLKSLKFGIDTINTFSYKGLYFNNALIFAIKNSDSNIVNLLLKNGSSSRGYNKYPGYPLFCAIEEINIKFRNNQDDISNLIIIIKNLVDYGARFDDYLVQIFWFKLDKIFESVDNKNLLVLKTCFNKSPFNYYKYQEYLDSYCNNFFIKDCKEKLLERFLEKYPTKRKSVKIFNFFFF